MQIAYLTAMFSGTHKIHEHVDIEEILTFFFMMEKFILIVMI
jgi:hypothetical protein